jgi:hypothetical protein
MGASRNPITPPNSSSKSTGALSGTLSTGTRSVILARRIAALVGSANTKRYTLRKFAKSFYPKSMHDIFLSEPRIATVAMKPHWLPYFSSLPLEVRIRTAWENLRLAPRLFSVAMALFTEEAEMERSITEAS